MESGSFTRRVSKHDGSPLMRDRLGCRPPEVVRKRVLNEFVVLRVGRENADIPVGRGGGREYLLSTFHTDAISRDHIACNQSSNASFGVRDDVYDEICPGHASCLIDI